MLIQWLINAQALVNYTLSVLYSIRVEIQKKYVLVGKKTLLVYFLIFTKTELPTTNFLKCVRNFHSIQSDSYTYNRHNISNIVVTNTKSSGLK